MEFYKEPRFQYLRESRKLNHWLQYLKDYEYKCIREKENAFSLIKQVRKLSNECYRMFMQCSYSEYEQVENTVF